MLNKKLLEVIQRLSPFERKRLRLFLLSPYFNSGNRSIEVTDLWDLIIANNAEESAPQLQKEQVFKQFYPDLTFESKVKSPLDSLTSELFRLVRLFLQQDHWEKTRQSTNELLVLAKFYRKHGLEDRFSQNFQLIRNIHSENIKKDASYYQELLNIEEEELNFRGLYNSFEDDTNLGKVLLNLDHHYIIRKLEFITALEYQNMFTNIQTDAETSINETVLRLSDKGQPFDTPINQIYHLIIRLIKEDGSDEDFEKLEQLLNENEAFFEPERFKDLMAYQRSLWIKRYRTSGGQDMSRFMFNLFRVHLEKGFFYLDNSIPLNAFYNLALIAIKLGEMEWVKQFLSTHTPERICGTRFPTEVYHLCTAEYLFAIKNFHEAEQTLVYKLFENSFISFQADVLLVKIYYETENELLETRMAALYKKVKRSKFTEEKQIVYLNFLSKLHKLVKLGPMPSKEKREKLALEVQSVGNMVSKEWILGKLRV